MSEGKYNRVSRGWERKGSRCEGNEERGTMGREGKCGVREAKGNEKRGSEGKWEKGK